MGFGVWGLGCMTPSIGFIWSPRFGSVCDVNGLAVAAPCDAEKILVVDPATSQASAIELPEGIDAKKDYKFVSVCAVNGKAVAVQYNAEKSLVVDPATGSASAIDHPADIDATRTFKFLYPPLGNYLYFCLYKTEEDIKHTVFIKVLTGEYRFGSVCDVNGKAVAVPWNAEKVLVIDPAGGQASTIDLPAGIDARKGTKLLAGSRVQGLGFRVSGVGKP